MTRGGGAYGTEALGGTVAPLFALIFIFVTPWVFSLPIALITAELATAMTDQAGFITWIESGSHIERWSNSPNRGIGQILRLFRCLYREYRRDYGFMYANYKRSDHSSAALYPVIFTDYAGTLFSASQWELYGLAVAFVMLGCIINLAGVKAVGVGSQILTLATLLPFVVFVITGFACGKFDVTKTVSTQFEEPDYALFFSVLLWAMCGYEYSGFLASKLHPNNGLLTRR